MPYRSRGRTAAVLAALMVLLSGCVDLSELQFKQDDRLDFTSPETNELVELPLEVTWTMDDFTALPPRVLGGPRTDAGYFAVFVDRAPVKPRESLDVLGEDDPACSSDPRCPDKRYLSSLGVYTTHRTSITIPLVPPLPSKEDVQQHQVTVVLLDAEGRRIGESAWFRQFTMENRGVL